MRGGDHGARRKPTALHRLHNTERARTRKARVGEPKPVGDLRTPPAYLTRSQKAGWRYVMKHAPAGLLKKIDRAALVSFVVAEDNFKQAVIADNQSAQERAASTMFRAISHLGFSPASRPRIHLDSGENAEGNPWAQFKVVNGDKA